MKFSFAYSDILWLSLPTLRKRIFPSRMESLTDLSVIRPDNPLQNPQLQSGKTEGDIYSKQDTYMHPYYHVLIYHIYIHAYIYICIHMDTSRMDTHRSTLCPYPLGSKFFKAVISLLEEELSTFTCFQFKQSHTLYYMSAFHCKIANIFAYLMLPSEQPTAHISGLTNSAQVGVCFPKSAVLTI